ncbi:MAG TPA: amino acid adenylation domain-containing protein [Phycisphaerales bacterium]|nr:amino acid adenylation domain-containing protein [Phycisphaerales bacterium]HRQ74677.1 amino acid adenylation domain-containing protein [Phycisphaerales bacterium]
MTPIAVATRVETLSELLHTQSQITPDTTAAEDNYGNTLTYRELDELSGRIAALLHAHGVQRGDRVGICMPKCVNSVACIHAALKVGAAYVPVDYASPPERNRYIFTNCQAKVICTDEPRAKTLEENGKPIAHRLTFPGEAPSGIGSPELSSITSFPSHPITSSPSDLAYILYTSGSTGVPKGVMHTHASAMSFVNWAADTLRPVASDRFSSHAPFHFDLSVLDLYVPLTAGAAVVVIGEHLGKQPHELAEFIAAKSITMWYSVPSILTLLMQFGKLEDKDFARLRTVCFAGEVFPIQHLKQLLSIWPDKDYYNLYGPTETNVCTYHKVQADDHHRSTPLPIGKVCENCSAMIVDVASMTGGAGFQPVKPGEEGLLYIHCSGPTMHGYWNDAERTNASTFTDSAGERWYCTGDVVVQSKEHLTTTPGSISGREVEITTVRRRMQTRTVPHDAVLTFIGRRDRMVKRHGYRIELGEIEAGLHKLLGVDEAAAVASETPKGVVITAFFSMKPNEKAPGMIALKQFCAQNLPSYMSPDRFTMLERLPRTSTDKINYPELSRIAKEALT